MTLRERMGFDAGGQRAEDAIAWAERNRFKFLDICCDTGPNRLDAWPTERVTLVRDACDRAGITIGLHTLSGVNIAEFSPHMSEAADEYLKSYIDLSHRLDAGWVIVHAGYHFSGEVEARRKASLERLKRASEIAARSGVRLLLENLNVEPEHAEVHYMAHTVEECAPYFEQVPPENLGWAFTVNHSNLVPDGIGGFLDAFGVSRIGEVRLADNTGEYEVHMLPGQGNIDFRGLFRRLEGEGYAGHYSMAFGGPDDKVAARERFVIEA